MEIIATKSETKNWANIFIVKNIKKSLLDEKNLIVLFEGNLGAGKTQIIKWICAYLKIKQTILSPTFTIWKIYPFTIKTNNKIFYLNHIDLYRLDKPNDIFRIGLRKKIKEPNNVFLIEWGEKIEKILKERYIKIQIKIIRNNKREIILTKSK